ncbi:MAG: bifunctional diaminohydroxyphosphoribosylaminopyrimidine deaminase/5-amino-6-(5-phosphoribosylamino)uracil reductase RibD [Chloroflexi bacterium]|nr:bifunctional diaminohydroxyphosphoribosylaminopyrimidine deaminase/5-amino-6-(5-phosphoribosylamino)uracil reductase RibD [Chloroflexota bacterium]
MPWMRHALLLARTAVGRASPNPAVGAVLVKDGQVIGRGATQAPGGPHAEIVALRAAGEAPRGSTLYVTLEPCCHHGRTPPCTEAIIAAGVAEVHIATLDPNPAVSGRGRAALEAAGIRTVLGEGEEAARALIAYHRKYITTGLPLVIAKFAASLDGKVATRTGHSQWITGPAAREYAHRVRARVDAILVGVNTVLADDPQLTARPGGRLVRRQPLRVVVDSRGRTPPQAQVLRGPGQALVAVTAQAPPDRLRALREAGAEVVVLPSDGDKVDVLALLRELGRREQASVLVEGGSTLLGSLFDRGLVDQVLAFFALLLIGGRDALPAVGGLGAATLAEALRLERVQVRRLGNDLLVSGWAAER